MALRSQIRRRQIRQNIDPHLIILFFLGTLLMIPAVSTAGGLYINEFGTPSMGDDPDQRQGINGYGRIAKCDRQVRSG